MDLEAAAQRTGMILPVVMPERRAWTTSASPRAPLFEVLVQEVVVRFRRRFDQLFPILLHPVGEGGRDIRLLGLAIRVHGRLQGHQVDHAGEPGFLPHGNLDGDQSALEAAAQRLQGAVEVRPLAVQAVDDDRPGQLVLAGELPDLLGLDLHPGHRVHDDEGRLDHPESGPRLRDEVAVARRVDEVDAMAFPVGVGQRRVDGDLPLDLVGIEVGGGGAVVGAPETGDGSGREEQGLHERRLAHAAVTDDADIANLSNLDRH